MAAFALAWKRDRQHEQQTSEHGTFMQLVFQPSEAVQVNWSEDCAILRSWAAFLLLALGAIPHS